ncbi:ATP-binding protein [uncultured Thiohalocapsa sp.]|uniref:ATP-binding protein n=1 Tax=uncultured Thiohalocapsa sp. TaxID=768990 RepID=UPI0025D9D9C3|nr:ATP-binding protein [uncultured Thiohalocapsa sp.]
MSKRSIESTDRQCGEALLRARAEIWEAAARGDATLILHTALCHALALTRSSTALLTLPASAAGPLRPAAEALVDGDGRVCCSVLQDAENAPAGEATDALARCRRQSLGAAELGAPVGLPAADGDETQPRTLAVPLLRTRAVAGVLAVADKPTRYLGAEAELLRGLAAMAADGLDALRVIGTEYRMRHADGGWRWLLDRWRVYARDEAGAQLRVAGVHLDITERKQAEERLAALNRSLEVEVAARTAEVQRQAEQLRALASRLTRTEQHERRRLATILHDHIQQLIVAPQIQVSRMSRAEDPTRLRGAAEEAGRSLAEALTASRSLAVELSPPVLHEHGLIGGLNWLVNRMREQHGLAVRLRADTTAEPADDDWHVLLFECVRELLLNVVKHAGVEHAEVTLTRSDTDALRLSVADAGAGFDPAALATVRPEAMSFGLFSIQQRLTHMGARMELQSAPDRGTRVDLAVPAAKHAKAAAAPVAVTAAAGPAAIEVRRRPRSWGVLIVDDHHIMREADAAAYVTKGGPPEDLIGAIRRHGRG